MITRFTLIFAPIFKHVFEFLALASRQPVLVNSVFDLGLGLFQTPWPRSLCPLLHSAFYCQPEVCVRVWCAIKVSLCGRWSQAKVRFISSTFHNLHELDRQAQSNQRVCHQWRKLHDQSFVVRRWSGFAFLHWIGLQRVINDIAVACENAGKKISTTKTEVLHLSRNLDQYSLQVSGTSLKQVEKFKYLGVVFTSAEVTTKNWTPEWTKLVQWYELCNFRLSWNKTCRKKQSSSQFLFPSSPIDMSEKMREVCSPA